MVLQSLRAPETVLSREIVGQIGQLLEKPSVDVVRVVKSYNARRHDFDRLHAEWIVRRREHFEVTAIGDAATYLDSTRERDASGLEWDDSPRGYTRKVQLAEWEELLTTGAPLSRFLLFPWGSIGDYASIAQVETRLLREAKIVVKNGKAKRSELASVIQNIRERLTVIIRIDAFVPSDLHSCNEPKFHEPLPVRRHDRKLDQCEIIAALAAVHDALAVGAALIPDERVEPFTPAWFHDSYPFDQLKDIARDGACDAWEPQLRRWMSQVRTATAGETGELLPHYDQATLVLSFGGETRKFGEQANAARVVLDAFQGAGWPKRLPDPGNVGRNPEQLKNTLKTLNTGPPKLRFRSGDGGGSYVWETVGG